ncbi:MAG: restriction endonuclease subunit S [Raoultella sp.]|nr:restriction endonuclease subunit S [Raoultella sp.]HDG9808946.1 restriction endonuclease subunit S [Raoultella planticola]
MVPEGWEIKALKDILSSPIRNGFSPIASDKETGFWVLGLGSLGDEGINVTEIKPVEPTDRVLQTKLSHGDFLVSRSNTPDKVGRSIYFRGEIENCSYPDLMMKFRVDESKAYPPFIEQKLKSFDVRAFFKNCAAGSSATMVKINKVILEKTPLLLPNIKEQKKIVQVLSTWDKAIVTTEQILANSQQQKKALMQQLLTGKNRFQEYDNEWSNYFLNQLFDFKKGKGLSKATLASNGRKCILYGELYTKYGEVITHVVSRTAENDGFTSKIGDILIPSSTTTTGIDLSNATAILEDQVLLGGDINVLRPKKKINSVFMAYLLTHIKKKDIASRAQGITIIHLYGSDLKTIKVFIPESITEQEKIVTTLLAFDNEIEILKQKLNNLKQEKKALMQQLLTGKRRVKVEAA